MSEQSEQTAVIRWARLFEVHYPKLRWLHASLNGAHMSPRHAARMKAAGMTKGIPDLFLPVRASGYNGLYIEMKIGKNKPTPEQEEFMVFARDQNFKAVIARGFDEAINILQSYVEGEK